MTRDDPFDIVPARPLHARPDRDPASFARGDDWTVEMDGDVFLLNYLSGEHGGGERAIAISDAEARALRDGHTSLDSVLIAHNAS